MSALVSIGEAQRNIAELVKRVADGGERIVLTSRGMPKAVLVSVADYERLQAQEHQEARAQWEGWLHQARELNEEILCERNGAPLDVDLVVQAAKVDLEERHDDLFGR